MSLENAKAFVKKDHEERNFFIFRTRGYDIYVCSNCGKEKEIRV